MKIKQLLIIGVAALVAFASCSKDDGGNGDGGSAEGTKQMFIKIENPADNNKSSRAVEAPVEDNKVDFLTGTIAFTKGTGSSEAICNIIKIVDKADAALADGETNVTQLKAGTLIGGIDAGAKKCYVYANTSNMEANLTVGQTMTVLKAKSWTLNDINVTDYNKVPLYGSNKVVTSVIKDGADDINVLRSDVTIAPISSRLQLGKISGGNDIKSFEVAGIYINNYTNKMYADSSVLASDIKNNGIDPDKYNSGKGSYATDTKMLDVTGFKKDVSDKVWIPDGAAGDVWGYNVFPNIKLTKKELPHIVVRLKDVVLNDGSDTELGEQFLTVVGYDDNGTSLVNLKGGIAYTIADLQFEEKHLSELPESGKDLQGYVKVSVVGWTTKPITGEFE